MRIVYIISDVNYISDLFHYEWTAKGLRDFGEIEIGFIIMGGGKPEIIEILEKHSFKTDFVICKSKKDWISAFFSLLVLLKKNKPDIIHCHLKVANILGLLAGFFCGVRNRIHTRHHGYVHHVRQRKSIIWDYIANILSTRIIANSKSTVHILNKLEGVDINKIYLIHHSIDMTNFGNKDKEIKEFIRKKYYVKSSDFVIGICSRLDVVKGYDYLIPALSKIFTITRNIKVLFFSGHSTEEKKYFNLAKNYLPHNSYQFIPFEENMAGAYSIMDIFIHVPIAPHEEGFGLVYVEAMASEIPCIFTKSGIGNEILKNNINSVIVKHKNQKEITDAINFLYRNQKKRLKIGSQARLDVIKEFDGIRMFMDLSKLYNDEFSKSL